MPAGEIDPRTGLVESAWRSHQPSAITSASADSIVISGPLSAFRARDCDPVVPAQSSGAAEGAVVVSPIGRGLVQGLAHTRSVHEVNLVGFYEARCAKGGDHRRREHAPAEAPMDVILVERASQLIAQAAVYLAEGHDAVKDAAIGSELDALVDAAIEVSRNAQTIVERLEGAVPNQGPAGIGDCRS